MATKDYIGQPDPSTRIWRYMDSYKLDDLLTTRTLYFCQAKQLGDPYEGSMHSLGFLDKDKLAGTELENNLKSFYNAYNTARAYTAVTCWQMSEHDDVLMWKYCLPVKRSVAIQTNVKKLNASLKNINVFGDVYAGSVSYEKLVISKPGENFGAAVLFFRKAPRFMGEKEYRIIFFAHDHKKLNREEGLKVPVDLSTLIERIYISPDEPDDTKVLLETQLNDLKLDIEVVSLTEKPEY